MQVLLSGKERVEMKKAMLLAAVACVAMFALPAVASATTWHLDKTDTFSGTGPGGVLKGGTEVKCTSTTVLNGKYETTTTGTVEFLFHGCTGPFGAACTTSGESSGTIRTTVLGLHNVVIGGVPGVLLTPNAATGVFAHFSCFGIPVTVHGNGILGTTNKKCGDKSSNATIDFNVVGGAQQHTVSTGVTYGLTSTTGGGASTPSTEEAEGTITFAGGERTITCT
jgi:hypothetical protein